MRRRQTFLRLILTYRVALVALAWFGCSGREAVQPQPVVTVQAATVERSVIQRVVSAEAVLYPLNEAVIVPKISAPISKFYVDRGDRVHAGELLADLENKDLVAALAQSKGAYEQAQAAYATATEVNIPAQVQAAKLNAGETKQAMDAAEQVYLSRQKLYQQGAIARNLLNQSQVVYIQARNQYQIAEATLKALEAVGRTESLKSAQAQLASAKGQYLAAQAQVKYSEIRSPIDGVVTSRPLFPGEMASAGTPLMTVMNVSRVVARAHISPEQAALLHVGDPATISAGSVGDDVQGRVSVVSPALDPNSTTVQVWVEAPTPKGRLKPGTTVNVRMIAQTERNALVIPASALLTATDGTTSVMAVGADGVAHQTQVQVGIREGGRVQIVSGLKEGEHVVAEGAFGLPDGTKVKF